MGKKRKLVAGTKVANWAASVPGTVQDWKDLGGKVSKKLSVVAPTPLWFPKVREWLMDSAAWGDMGLLVAALLVQVAGIVYWTIHHRRKVQATENEGRRAALEARQDERTKLLVRRMARAASDEPRRVGFGGNGGRDRLPT